MVPATPKPRAFALLTAFFALAFSACAPRPTPVLLPTITILPTPAETPIPLAVSVNGEGIPLPEFQSELARYQQAQSALGNSISLETAIQAVRDELVDTLLLAQGAQAGHFFVADAVLQARVDALAAQVGGTNALATWESVNGYTAQEFRSDLSRQIAAAWMRDKVTGVVPTTADQVHVKQVLFYNAGDAQQALINLKAGLSFDDLAAQVDPLAKGELGWFPRGYLPSKAIEDAAFALQPGQYSDIVHDETGYHILYLVELDPARLLSPDALLTIRQGALQDWLTQRRAESKIVFSP